MAASRPTQPPLALVDRDQSPQRVLLTEMFNCALSAVSAEIALPARLPPPVDGTSYILAIGKAAAAMAKVAIGQMSGQLTGTILTRYGHNVPGWSPPAQFRYVEAGHPLPDAVGAKAALGILADVQALGPSDQLVALISGGGSALLTLPALGVSLAEKSELTQKLLRSGATISEINCVRKHLSGIKGGRLALAAHPARVVTIAISDIPGDDMRLIASGPTLPDGSTLEQAQHIIEKYAIEVPPSIERALHDERNETPDSRSPAFRQPIPPLICARAANALEAAGQYANANGYAPRYLGDDVEGNASDVATIHAALALHYLNGGQRCALLSGGETTVVVRNANGRGGRNTEYLLTLAIALDGHPAITAMACDTDGIDGTEDNAGAMITPDTLARARALGLDARAMLRENRSYAFFEALGDLVMTGPTRTNVNDFRAILIDPAARTPGAFSALH
jgi:glycerate 2-kinase